jgi:mono/diheme cytochrome c family protein
MIRTRLPACAWRGCSCWQAKEITMPRKIFAIFLLCLAHQASADPFAGGDASIGKQMVQKHCINCHASSFGGDGSGIYTREDRIVKTAKGLVQQVRNCNTNLGLKWFDDEEMHVAAYLNQTYYHLK